MDVLAALLQLANQLVHHRARQRPLVHRIERQRDHLRRGRPLAVQHGLSLAVGVLYASLGVAARTHEQRRPLAKLLVGDGARGVHVLSLHQTDRVVGGLHVTSSHRAHNQIEVDITAANRVLHQHGRGGREEQQRKHQQQLQLTLASSAHDHSSHEAQPVHHLLLLHSRQRAVPLLIVLVAVLLRLNALTRHYREQRTRQHAMHFLRREPLVHTQHRLRRRPLQQRVDLVQEGDRRVHLPFSDP